MRRTCFRDGKKKEKLCEKVVDRNLINQIKRRSENWRRIREKCDYGYVIEAQMNAKNEIIGNFRITSKARCGLLDTVKDEDWIYYKRRNDGI